MANIVYGCRTSVAAIYIAHVTSRSVIGHSNRRNLTVQAIYIYISHADVTTIISIFIRITQIRISYATRVDIYTETTSETRTCITWTYARGKRTSSVQFIWDRVAIIPYWLSQLAWRNAWRSLSTSMMSKSWHIWTTTAWWFWQSRTGTEAFANDSLKRKTKVFWEQCINHWIYSAVAVS